MTRVTAYEVAGELWPVHVEVRLKPGPCWHDAEPASQDPSIVWERRDRCDCWPDEPCPGVEHVPSGGFPVRLLRNLHMNQLLDAHANAVANRKTRFDVAGHPRPEVARHYRAIETAAERPAKQRGRPKAEPRLHLERLAALDRAYATNRPQDAAARKLGIAPQTLRASLEWARRQEPPLWTRSGRGRRGQLTPHGRALIEEHFGDSEPPPPRKAQSERDRRARRRQGSNSKGNA